MVGPFSGPCNGAQESHLGALCVSGALGRAGEQSGHRGPLPFTTSRLQLGGTRTRHGTTVWRFAHPLWQ